MVETIKNKQKRNRKREKKIVAVRELDKSFPSRQPAMFREHHVGYN
jgi:hypothetical protein